METLLRGDALVAQLAADHENSKQFMKAVGDKLDPLYRIWRTKNAWEDVEVPETTEVPVPWMYLDAAPEGSPSYQNHEVDENEYTKMFMSSGRTYEEFLELWNTGLGFVLQSSENVDLLSPGQFKLDEGQSIHKATSSLFTSQCLFTNPEISIGAELGEITLTNIGNGDKEDYLVLHTARARLLKVGHALFVAANQEIQANSMQQVEQLSQALYSPHEADTYSDRKYYNPLHRTVMEGLMTTGQVVNYLVQPGIADADMGVLDLSRAILRNRLPVSFSRLVQNADIGPNQMAGLAVGGLLASKDRQEVDFFDEAITTQRRSLDKYRAEIAIYEGEDLELMQRPEVRAVSRGQGCPAGKLVRLSCDMLLDALNAA